MIPVFWEILHREIEGCEEQHEKGWEVAYKLLEQAIDFGFPKLAVCADSWFAGEPFFRCLDGKGYIASFKLKINDYGIDIPIFMGISMAEEVEISTDFAGDLHNL